MKTQPLIPVLFFFLSNCAGEPAGGRNEGAEGNGAPPAVSLRCDSISWPDGSFSGFALYAIVDAYKVKIAEIGSCEPISRESYADYRIPPDALAAAGSGRAAGSDFFYAREADGQILFIRKKQPAGPAPGPAAGDFPVATYRDGKFLFEPERK